MSNTILSFFLCLGIFVIFILKFSEALRIFSYQPVPFDSHQTVFQVFTDSLVQDGHELVVLTPLPRKHPVTNIMEIDVHEISYSGTQKGYDEASRHRKSFGIPDYLEFIKSVRQYMNPVFDLQLSHPHMQALINNKTEKFDLILVEANTPSGVVLRARFDAQLLLFSTMTVNAGIFHLLGAETNYFFYPDALLAPIWDLSFWQKTYSFYNFVRVKFANSEPMNYGHSFLKKHIGKQAPSIKELEKYVSMLFLNAYRFWDNNRPVPIGSVLYLGGLHLSNLKPPNSLPYQFKTLADNSKHGLVIMSLGSKLVSSTLPAHTLRIIIDVFSQLPYDVIWKWNTDELPNKPHNLHIVKRLPQNDLLHHPKIRAFITHSGLLSTHEAIAARVPLVGLPVWPDHWQNAWQYEKLGIGICLDIDRLTKEDFKNAIVAVAEDKKFRDNIDRVSRIVADNRESPLQTASRWAHRLGTTRAARYIRSPLADTKFGSYYMLDVMLTTTISIFFLSITIVYTLKSLIIVLRRKIFEIRASEAVIKTLPKTIKYSSKNKHYRNF